jgi:hypothetical protein
MQKRTLTPERLDELKLWSRYWREWIGGVFFSGYSTQLHGTDLLPKDNERLRVLTNSLLLENAFTELSVALTRGNGRERPALEGIIEVLERTSNHASL